MINWKNLLMLVLIVNILSNIGRNFNSYNSPMYPNQNLYMNRNRNLNNNNYQNSKNNTK